jgi:asparagine synthase (glutamine-hydrolysing)
MTTVLRHRGPDDEGVWIDGGVGLGNRRLAIRDLSQAGHQPMLSVDGRFALTYNGEIYNNGQLRRELEDAGKAPDGGWRGNSDTETLLTAIAAWGIDCTVSKSTGMFAFAVWDRLERKLTIARDRFGEKPLYYGWCGRDFVFASELKSIRCHPHFDATLDRRAVRTFADLSYVPAPMSIYRGIFKLPPASILEISGEAAVQPRTDAPVDGSYTAGLSLRSYWSYKTVLLEGLRDPISDFGSALEALDCSLSDAIKAQRVADVPVGTFLSGGIDSSTLVALYQRDSGRPVQTYTIGFETKGFNEAPYARAVADYLETDHHERILTAREALEVIPDLPQIYDEPFADSSQIPTYLISRFAREEVTVALAGDGGDELFGGYNRYVRTARVWTMFNRLPKPVRTAALAGLGSVPAGAWQFLSAAIGETSPFFGTKVRNSFDLMRSAGSLEKLFTGLLSQWGGSSPFRYPDEVTAYSFDLKLVADAPPALRMMYCDGVSYLPDDLLCKVDRASMAASLEVRNPYLDHHVAAVAARIPMRFKVRGSTGKHILKELLYREAPRELFRRPKVGFAMPVGEWLRGPLREWAEDLLDTNALADGGWFQPAAVRLAWRRHLACEADLSPALWTVLAFQAWSRATAAGAG